MSKAKLVPESPTIGSEEDFDIEEQEMTVDFLRGGYSRLNRAMKEVESNQELLAMQQILERLDPLRSQHQQSQPGSSRDQVHSRYWEQN